MAPSHLSSSSSFLPSDSRLAARVAAGDVLVCGGSPESARRPLLLSIPHAGERVPPETPWLTEMPDALRLFDVDRAVDLLYGVAIDELQAPTVVCPWHRYAADLNRLPSDIDAASVVGSTNPVGSFPRGFHWSITTAGQPLMPGPMAPELHERLVERCSEPFHLALAEFAKVLISRAAAREILHLDLHSMPSLGTSEHRDPGELRKDVVISDRDGMSAKREWVELVVEAYRRQGFSVAVNWPYKGGRLTEYYGRPKSGHHTIQVELNRALYMDETSKALHTDRLTDMQIRLAAGLSTIYETLPQI